MSQNADTPPPAPEEPLSDERLPLTELESLNTRPPSWRKRGVQLALLALALIVALVALRSALTPGARQTTLSAAPTLPPSPALLVSNLTNATITFNGKKLAGHPPLAVSASLESDEATIAAPGFHPYTCHFKYLKTTDDVTHCLLTTNGFPQINNYQFFIGIYLTPDDLLPAQRDQVVAPIMQQLATSQQAAVQPGEYIATAMDPAGNITSRRAAAPLQATATFVQSASLEYPPYPSFSPACAQLLCPDGIGPASFAGAPTGQVWDLLLKVALRWRFTDSSGTPVADVTYATDPLSFRLPTFLPIRFIHDTTGWHLAAGIDLNAEMWAALCQTGIAILQQRAVRLGNNSGIQLLRDAGVAGCLLSFQSNGTQLGTVLWRLGVLLAVDAGVQKLFPDLPVAPPAEINAVGG